MNDKNMKKIFLLITTVLTVLTIQGQVVNQDEQALVYYTPKNHVVLDFTYTITVQEAGPYYLFAEQLLGATNAISENQTIYALEDVHIGTRTEADRSRAHKVVPEQGVASQLLSIDSRGLLLGYNLPYEERKSSPRKQSKENITTSTPSALPLTDEQLEQRTPEARAKAIAKQIYRIRESRIFLLSGEVEHAPSDGKSMQLVLSELDKQENQLLALFLGSTTTRTEHYKIELNPSKDQQTETLQLFFSAENGFTHADNIDADTISILMTTYPQVVLPGNEKKNKKAPQASQIVYNLPGQAEVDVTYQGETLGHKVLQIAQLGIDVPLSRDLFIGDKLPIIRFDLKTGNVESISR